MIKSFCKINLSLRVLQKLKKKLHNIETNSFLINVFDQIKVKKIKNKNDLIIFKGRFNKLVNKSKNSLISVLKFLRDENIIKKNDNYKITVNKKIPVFSGLGGGTSNAFFLFKYFYKKKIELKFINKLENKIGTDIRLFFQKQCFQKSLNKIIRYKNFYNFYFILVYPKVKCSTKEIYSKVKKLSKPSYVNFDRISSKEKFIEKIKKEKNDLEPIAVKKFDIIQRVNQFISIQPGCYFSRMTGSGSVCFGMFKSLGLANKGLKTIKKKFPNYWCVVTKTI